MADVLGRNVDSITCKKFVDKRVMQFFSIRTRLIVALTLILLSGFLVTNVISYRASKQQIHSSIVENSLPLARDNIYSEIQRDLMRPIFVSSLMANDTFLKDWVTAGEIHTDQIIRYLTEIQDKYGFFSSFFVSDITGNYYHFKGILKQIHPDDDHDVWYYRFREKNVEYDLDVDTNEAERNHLTIFINHRLTSDDGRFLGVVGVGLDFDRVASLLEDYRARYHRSIYMVSPDGIIQVHTDQSKILTTSIFDQPGLGNIADDIMAAGSQPAFFEYDADDSHILLTSRFVEELDWYLLVEQDETLALKSIQTTFVQNFFIGLGITVITILFAILMINYFQHQLEIMATTDKMTKAYNRREFERRFHFHTDANRRKNLALSIILFDIDRLKELNDTLGHLAGDQVIKNIAGIAAATIRDNDMLVRWGGDEFVILITGTTDQAFSIACRLLEAVQAYGFPDGYSKNGLPQVSISCGVAGYDPGDTLESLMARADKAMYRAKHEGRNRVVVADRPD
jgi:diguanylate cyclase (GGDEF)-like protein